MRIYLYLLLVSFFVFGGVSTVLAGEADAQKTTAEALAEAEQIKAEDSFLKGVNLGAGIMANAFAGGKKPVESASVAGGVVRIAEEGRGQVGVVAEFHTLWKLCKGKEGAGKKLYSCGEDPAQFGVGPAIGLKLGSNNIIDAIFLGPMFAFRPNTKSSNSFNLALGVVMAPKVKVLGDGIEEGKPLPAGETEVRYKKENKFGYGILLSFAF